MSKARTTWIHAFDVYNDWFIFRADFIVPDGRHRICQLKLNREDLHKRGRLAVVLRRIQRAIDREFGEGI